MGFYDKGFYRLIPGLTWQAREQVSRVLKLVPTEACILDLGAGGRKISPKTICLDFLPDVNTNVVGDVEHLPFREATVDLIYATGLFEHVADERALIGEIDRVLRPGGIVHIEAPFLEQYHEDPIDCRRFTVEGLELAMQRIGFETIERGAHIGPTVAMLNIIARWGALWFEGKSTVARAASLACYAALSTLFWPFKFLDRFLIEKAGAHRLAMGVYYTGRKPN